MERNQKAQKEGVNAVLNATRGGTVESPPPTAPAVKPPRPMVLKLSKKDDTESYLDMFETVAGKQ